MEAQTILSDVRAELLSKFGVAAYAFSQQPTQLLPNHLYSCLIRRIFKRKRKGISISRGPVGVCFRFINETPALENDKQQI
jgi:hypothetical protein